MRKASGTHGPSPWPHSSYLSSPPSWPSANFRLYVTISGSSSMRSWVLRILLFVSGCSCPWLMTATRLRYTSRPRPSPAKRLRCYCRCPISRRVRYMLLTIGTVTLLVSCVILMAGLSRFLRSLLTTEVRSLEVFLAMLGMLLGSILLSLSVLAVLILMATPSW